METDRDGGKNSSRVINASQRRKKNLWVYALIKYE
jgi:hypothetical protein